MFAISGTKYDGVQLPGMLSEALGSKAFSCLPPWHEQTKVPVPKSMYRLDGRLWHF